MAITQPIQVATNKTQRELCDDSAVKTMSGMRFSSSEGALEYRKMLTDKCMGIVQPSQTVVAPVSQPVVQTPVVQAPVVQAPVKAGVSAIVEPDFTNVKVYDLDTPSGAPSGASNVTSGGYESSIETISEGNGEGAPTTLSTVQKPNYILYGGIAISAILLYKFLK